MMLDLCHIPTSASYDVAMLGNMAPTGRHGFFAFIVALVHLYATALVRARHSTSCILLGKRARENLEESPVSRGEKPANSAFFAAPLPTFLSWVLERVLFSVS